MLMMADLEEEDSVGDDGEGLTPKEVEDCVDSGREEPARKRKKRKRATEVEEEGSSLPSTLSVPKQTKKKKKSEVEDELQACK